MDKHPEAGILIHNKIGKRLVNTIFSSTYLSQYLVSFVQNFLTIHLSLIRFNWKDAQPRFPLWGAPALGWGSDRYPGDPFTHSAEVPRLKMEG
jgi:hypothetical protein